MKTFDYQCALNALGVGTHPKLNKNINYKKIPEWVAGDDFLKRFLPYLRIIGDSREQDIWVKSACQYFGIAFETAKKGKSSNNLKEGDYTFQVEFGNRTYDYIGKVAYERKGAISEFYGNCTAMNRKTGRSDRDRIGEEFERFKRKGYDKVVLMLQFGEKLTDLIGLTFEFRGAGGIIINKNVGHTLYAAVMSWKQPNNKDFDIIQSFSKSKLFWLFLQDCYYYFRNELRNECEEKGLIEKDGEKEK